MNAEETTVRFGGNDLDRASAAVIEAVVDSTGLEMEELPPLYNAVDPDALDTIFDGDDRAAASSTLLSFDFGNTRVYVDAEGVEVKPVDGDNGQR